MYGAISFAQTQSPLWCIPSQTINFAGTAPSISTMTALGAGNPSSNDYNYTPAGQAFNSMNDINGDLLFFVTQNALGNLVVYDKDGIAISDANGLSVLTCNYRYLANGIGQPLPGQPPLEIASTYWAEEVCIVPDPGNCQRYYIIAAFKNTNDQPNSITYFPVYAKVDFSGPTPLLIASSSTANVFNLASIPGVGFDFYTIAHDKFKFGMAVTPSAPTGVQNHLLFIYSPYYTSRDFTTFQIDASGISYLSASDITATLSSARINEYYSEMEIVKLSNGNYRLAKSIEDFNIFWCDFDAVGAIVPGSEKIVCLATNPSSPNSSTNPSIEGLEFSPDGNTVYYSVHGPADQIGYITNLSATSGQTAIAYSGITDYVGFIENGNDGRMYFNQGMLVARTNPDSPAAGFWDYYPAYPLGVESYLLPDQIDGQNYQQANNSSVRCCFETTKYTVNSFSAKITDEFPSTTQIWTPQSNPFGGTQAVPVSTITVKDALIIPSGFNITIKGLTFQFKPRTYATLPTVTNYGAYVEVQRGAKLTLTNNGTSKTIFTSSELCAPNSMWEGVQVWGNPVASQTPANQGWLIMNNVSTITRAYIGATAGRIDFTKRADINGIIPPIEGGGIIQTYTNAEFLNNVIGVYFAPYNIGNNISTFNTTKFTTNALFKSNDSKAKPVAMAQLMDITGVQFRTCVFKNYVPAIYSIIPAANVNCGIMGINSRFFCNPAVVNASTGIGTGCTFENLKYAINATVTSTKTVTADQNIFKNCFRGAYIGNVIVATFTLNKFFIFQRLGGTEQDAAYGLYLDYCTGFKVQENKFYYNSFNETTQANVVNSYNVYGCIVNRSNPNRKCSKDGYTGDEIYKNDFKQIFIATQAQGDNSEGNVSSTNPPGSGTNSCYPGMGAVPNNIGLVFRCNNYQGVDKYNLRITNYSLTNTSGNIAYQQGTSINPAGNRFSHDIGYSTATQNEIRFDATYSTNNPNNVEYVYQAGNVAVDRTEPNFFTPYTGYLNPTGITKVPLTIMGLDANSCPSKIPVIKAPVSFELIKTSQDIIDAKTLVLASGDNQSLLDVIAMGNTGPLLNELMGQSPYLSDRVLTAAINKQLPPGHIKQIIIANSPVTPVVKSALDAASLPAGIRNLVNAAQTGVSERKKTEDIITENTYLKGYYYNEIIRYYLNDTINPNGLDSVIKTVKGFNAPDNLCAVTKAYLAKGDYVKAQQTVNDASGGGICNYLNTLIKIAQKPEGVYAIETDLGLREEVSLIAADPVEELRVGAMSILKLVLDEVSLQAEMAIINSDAIDAGDASVLTWMQENPFQEWLEPIDNTRSMFHFDTEKSNTAINDIWDINIYPNPANNIINISYQLPDDAAQAIVNTYDYTGKLVSQQTIYGNKGLASIGIENLPTGLYMYSIIVNATTIATQRIVISK